MYNHAWDPFCGSVLVDEPTPNSKTQTCAKKLDLQRPQPTSLKTCHCTDLGHEHQRLFVKKQCGLLTHSEPVWCGEDLKQ